MSRGGLVLLSGLLLAMPAFTQGGEALWSVRQPNVLILLVDDMGYGDPGCFHPQSKIATPHLDRLAAEGMRFTDAHAPGSICVPSRYGLLSGRLPLRTWNSQGARRQTRHGHERLHFPPPMIQSEARRPNLATWLKHRGYTTACIGKWHQGMSSEAQADGTLKFTPVDLGFDSYFGFDAPEQGPYAFIEDKRFVAAPALWLEDHPGVDVTNPETQGAHWRKGLAAPDWNFEKALPVIAAKADQWLSQHATAPDPKPFFLYYALPAPHAPWMTAAEFKGRSGAGPYGDYVMTVDAMAGRILATLERLKFKENTLVFFTSDNGPVWYEQDVARYQHHAAGPWRGRKGDLHEGGHRMPFIAAWPGRIQPGSTCDQLICFTDIFATLAALMGENLPPDAGEDSFDIGPLLRGEHLARPVRGSMIHVNYGSYNLAIRAGDWKLILPEWVYVVKDRTITPDHLVPAAGKGPKSGFELYNLREDPGERTNRFAREPARAAELFAILKADIQRGRSR